jgi:ubiquinone/menaquinone biosynthesis C-methylase UbiE
MSTRDGRADWDAVAAHWERGRRVLWEATRPVSEWLVERLELESGQTVLELAAGTGETGFLAAPRLEPGGRLITSDRSAAMLEGAERLAEEIGLQNVVFRQLDAVAIDLPDRSVEGVLSRFGYILKGEPPLALTEIKRVLRPLGRLAFAVWAQRERNSWMTVPAEVMQAHGYIPAPSQEERRLSERRNPKSIAELVEQAGYRTVECEEMDVTYRFGDRDELWQFVSELRGPLSAVLGRLDDAQRMAVRDGVEQRVAPGADGSYALGGVSVNVVAR